MQPRRGREDLAPQVLRRSACGRVCLFSQRTIPLPKILQKGALLNGRSPEGFGMALGSLPGHGFLPPDRLMLELRRGQAQPGQSNDYRLRLYTSSRDPGLHAVSRR